MAPNNSVSVTIEKPNNSFSKTKSFEKQKAASTKQFTWVLLLKVNRVFACLSWLPMAFRKRITSSDMSDEEPRNRGKLYRFIQAFLIFSIVALGVEVIAHYKNWNMNLIHHPWEVQGLLHWSYMAWLSFRVDYVAPVAIFLSKFCIVLFLIQSLDRLILCLGCFWIKFKKIKPRIEPDAYDVEDQSSFPMVLLQIPMCNEREVYEQSIAAACQMDWPRDRLLIQVLDDSDDIILQL